MKVNISFFLALDVLRGNQRCPFVLNIFLGLHSSAQWRWHNRGDQERSRRPCRGPCDAEEDSLFLAWKRPVRMLLSDDLCLTKEDAIHTGQETEAGPSQ